MPAVHGSQPPHAHAHAATSQPQTEEEIRGRLEQLAALGARSAEVAHELRNALSVLETSLHLVRRAVKSSPDAATKAEPHFARIAEQIHAGQAIVREVLDDARFGLDLGWLDLRGLVLEMIAGIARPEHVEIEAEVARLKVYVDGRQIRQLLLNLVRNAIEAQASPRATPRPGKVRIVAAVESEKLLLSVEDDGPGIDASVASRLFQPFATGKRGGTGLGLALCRRIARAHGGDITVQAKAPRGTRFAVTLPLPVSSKPPSEGKIRRGNT
jgi:signal transduction histidine kinase